MPPGPGSSSRGPTEKGAPPPVPHEGRGRNRGGLTTKLHRACDGKGRPLSRVVTPGQWRDNPQLVLVLDGICVPNPDGKGRPRRRGIPTCIPERKDQRERRTHRPGRKPAFDPAAYPPCNVVTRCNNRLKQGRPLATRYEKRGWHFRAMVVIAALLLWLPR